MKQRRRGWEQEPVSGVHLRPRWKGEAIPDVSEKNKLPAFASKLVFWFVIVARYPPITCERSYSRTQPQEPSIQTSFSTLQLTFCVIKCFPPTSYIHRGVREPYQHRSAKGERTKASAVKGRGAR